jgi:hypothetical protein
MFIIYKIGFALSEQPWRNREIGYRCKTRTKSQSLDAGTTFISCTTWAASRLNNAKITRVRCWSAPATYPFAATAHRCYFRLRRRLAIALESS